MHRVYVADGECWTLASVYVNRAPLPRDSERLVVYETARPPSVEEVCALTPDGRRLCDIGPGHQHEDAWIDPIRPRMG